MTVIDLFSRYPWLIPIIDQDSKSVAIALIDKVFCDLGVFPSVIRSDRGSEFTGHIIEYLDKAFGIKHVYGSAYHPQSQGIIERSHRSLSDVLAPLCKDHPEQWEAMMPRVQFALRSLPRKSLGGRSPLEVVTGLRPQFPNALSMGVVPISLTTDDYCKRLVESLCEVYAQIHRKQLAEVESKELSASKGIGCEFEVGDLVLVRRPSTFVTSGGDAADPIRVDGEPIPPGQKIRVSSRLLPRTYPRIYRVVSKISPTTYALEDAVDATCKMPFAGPQNISRLVRIEECWMSNPFAPGASTRLEVLKLDGVTWEACRAVELSVDGRVGLRWDCDPATVEFIDLTQRKYRFVV